MTTRTAPDIFLSYSRQDLAVAGQMAAALKAAGHDVWWDQALKAGEVYDRVTETALREARVVVVLWSQASVASDWVRSEATVAMQRGAMMPAMIEACQRPVMFELRQSADLTGWKGNAKDPRLVAFLADVARQLATPAAGTPAKAAAVPAPAPPSGPSRRLLIGSAAGAAALAAGGFGAWQAFGGKSDDGTASVVVLPFANLSGDPAQAFFSDGIAEELRNALSQIRGLKVIGRVSSEKFRDTDDLSAAAAKLGVDHVLTGSVRRSPSTIRIAAQLVDGRSGVESWSASYDQPIGDALAIQSKIATSVVAALSAKLGAAAGQILVGGTQNVQAQELALKARALYFENPSVANYQRILAMLDEAVTLDPKFSVGWAGIGFMKGNLAFRANSDAARAELLRDQGVACRRAVALAPNSGFSRVALAVHYQNALNMRAAVAQSEAALRLEPGTALVPDNASGILMAVDPDRAVALAQQATQLDPLNAIYFDRLARALCFARRYADAAEAGRQTLALSQGRFGQSPLSYAMLGLGQNNEARASLPGVSDPIDRLTLTAIVEHRLGNRAASDAALATLRPSTAGQINVALTAVHAQRGETGAALDTLEVAQRRMEVSVVSIAVDPLFDSIRREPRFKAVQDAVIPPDLFVRPKRWPA